MHDLRCYLAEMLFWVILWLLPKGSEEELKFAELSHDYAQWLVKRHGKAA